MDTCPNCGSRKGWYQKATFADEVVGNWGEEDGITGSMRPTWISSIIRCISCNKGMNKERYHRILAKEQ